MCYDICGDNSRRLTAMRTLRFSELEIGNKFVTVPSAFHVFQNRDDDRLTVAVKVGEDMARICSTNETVTGFRIVSGGRYYKIRD